MVEVKVYNGSENPLPAYSTEGAAAMDVYSAIDTFLSPGVKKLIPTNLFVEIPTGFKINVLPRSGFALKQGVTVINAPGLIDEDYRGNLGVVLINHSGDTIDIRVGDRVAQIEIVPVYKIKWVPVASKDDLAVTARGEGGFGSTGIAK
jgi:dUTP pyrophosphatase